MADGYRGDEYLYESFSGLGRNLGQAIAAYRQRYEQTKVLDAEMEALTRIPDVTGKTDSHGNPLPVLNPKVWADIKTHNFMERSRLETGMLQAMEFGTQLQQAHANINRAILADKYPGGGGAYLYDKRGIPYAQFNPRTGTYVKMPQPGVEGDTAALTKHANTILAGQGQTKEGFMSRTNEEQGYVKPDAQTGKLTGEFTKDPEQVPDKDVTKNLNAVRYKIGNRQYTLPMNDFDALTRVYPRKGDPGYTEPVKVGQPQGGGSFQYPIGTRARFGNTWKIMTDQGWQVENQLGWKVTHQRSQSAAIGDQGDQGDEGQ